MKKKIYCIGIAAFLFGCLQGCKEEGMVQTVDWYKEHTAEREAVVTHCKNNPGALEMTPNCINADRANNLVHMSKVKHINLKPLPPEFFQKQ